MRRVVAFFEWHADWWTQQARRDDWGEADRDINTKEHAEGRIAYALRQADIRTDMADRCKKSWGDVETYLALESD